MQQYSIKTEICFIHFILFYNYCESIMLSNLDIAKLKSIKSLALSIRFCRSIPLKFTVSYIVNFWKFKGLEFGLW